MVIFHEEKFVMGETNSELERIFKSYRYQVKNMLSIVSSIYNTLFEVHADESNMRARNL